jgi:hypothetical protein
MNNAHIVRLSVYPSAIKNISYLCGFSSPLQHLSSISPISLQHQNRSSMRKLRPIKVGMLAAYDYEYLKTSLPLVYEHADQIAIAADSNNLSWAGNPISIPDAFWEWVKAYDTCGKIQIYRDAFYQKGLTAVEVDYREHQMLIKFMGDEDGWHIHIDADEYFVDFKHFVDYLHYLDRKKPYINAIIMEWLTIFKRTEKGFIFVQDSSRGTRDEGRKIRSTQQHPLGSCTPKYMTANRRTKPQKPILYPMRVVHERWARTEEELLTKLRNWTHNDQRWDDFVHFWQTINEQNYMNLCGGVIKTHRYAYIEAQNVPDLLQKLTMPQHNHLLRVVSRLPLKWRLQAITPLWMLLAYRRYALPLLKKIFGENFNKR